MSPFKVVFGREPPSVVPYEVHNTDPLLIQESLINRDRVLQHLKANLMNAQNYMRV